MVRRQRPLDLNPEVAADAKTCKGVIVGDNAIGKTYLLRAFARCHPEDVYYPRREGVESLVTIMVDGKPRDYKSKESVPDELLREYIPTGECTEHHFSGMVNGQAVDLHFWDTPCIDGWTDEETQARGAMRAEIYPRADFVLLCFSVCGPTSLANVQKKWYPELQRFAPEARVLLLGMKAEFREDWETKEALRKIGMAPTTYEDGEQVAREIDAVQYLECTVIDRESVVRVLETIIRLVKIA